MSTVSALWGVVASELLLFGLFWLATAQLQSREQRSGARALCAFNLTMAVGLLLLALRPQWPGLLTIPGANIMILLALALLWHGGAMHLRGTSRREPFVVLALGAVAMIWMYFGWPQSNGRVMVLFLLASWVFVRASWLGYPLLMRRGVHGQRAARVLRMVAWVAAGILTYRALSGFWTGERIDVGSDTFRSYATAFGVMWGLTIVNGVLAYAVVRTLMRELERLATVDVLTGLMNRRAFLDSCDKRWALWSRQRQVFALASIDVDHFKAVNDTYGHATGDEVLKLIAHAIQANARPNDEVARVGGEEMVVIFGNVTSEDHVVQAAERLRQAVHTMAGPKEMGDARLTVSIGVAWAHAEDTTPQSVLRRSDEALYQAKSTGRNRVCLHPVHESRSTRLGQGLDTI